MWPNEIRKLLQDSLDTRKDASAVSTIRSVARKAGISSGALSEIISGKRPITEATGRKLLRVLEIGEPERQELTKRMESAVRPHRVLLKEEAYELITKWHYFAILSIFEMDDAPTEASAIAELLSLPESKIRTALERLVKYGLLEKSSAGHYSYLGTCWTTTDGIGSETIRDAHIGELRLAQTALELIPVENRDFTSVTFSASESQLEQARREVRRFRDRLTKIMSRSEVRQVYKLNIQLFPVVRWGIGIHDQNDV